MGEEVLGMLKEFLNAIADDDEFFRVYAKLVRKMVNALIDEGFTQDQALAFATQYMSNIGKH